MALIAFGIVAACLLASALLVATSKNLVHAVLWLAVTLVATAALYVMLGAEFLAGIQVLLYAGGVITLMLFGVMLTRREQRIMVENETSRRRRPLAAFTSLGLFALLALAIIQTPQLPQAPASRVTTTAELGRSILGEHLLAFEVLSVLLLAAMIGAIVLARRHDHGAEPQSPVRRRTA
ncbi:MAG: NADH-quinone oxidoreductase subunit J [Polyangiaceae bacterium]